MPAPAHAIDAIQGPVPSVLDVWHTAAAPPLTVTYAFEAQQSGEFLRPYTGWRAWTEEEKAAVRRGLAEYETVINVRYVEVAAGSDPDLAFGRVDTPSVAETWWKLSYGLGPTGQVANKSWDSGTVFDNAVDLTSLGARWLILHEIGHAMMMKHTGDYDSTGASTPGPFLPPAEDNRDYTVMSYVRGANDSSALQLQLYDIAALQARWGANTAEAGGDSVYTFDDGPGIYAIWDTGGVDRIDAGGAAAPVDISLAEGAFSTLGGQNTISIAWGAEIEDAVGGGFADRLRGNGLANHLAGGDGADTLQGGGGDDVLDGGAGVDVAVFAGAAADYEVTAADGGWLVRDLVAGRDGRDTLQGVEMLRFTDRARPLLPAAVDAAVGNVLRTSAGDSAAAAVAGVLMASLAAGAGADAAVAEIVRAADATTSVATLSYQFFTGRVPSLGGIDYLVAPGGPNPNNLNSVYYQGFNLENRYINFAVNLGRDGEGKAWFAQAYGGLSLTEATRAAYAEIFGLAPSDAKVAALLSGGRDLYFAAYGGDGANGQGTKAAMVGWLLAEAEKADIGMYARANAAFLTDLADGAAFGVDIVGVYGRPDFDYGGA